MTQDSQGFGLDPARIMMSADGDPAENPWVRGGPQPEDIAFEPHNPDWATRYETIRQYLAARLQGKALHIAHIGSTAVPGLLAKPVIDIDLIVADPEKEEVYVTALETLGFELTIRERAWYQHRMLRLESPRINLHVFGPNCPEHLRHVLFRDWLCTNAQDRDRYAAAKLAARDGVLSVEDYNQRKRATILDIYRRIFEARGWIKPV